VKIALVENIYDASEEPSEGGVPLFGRFFFLFFLGFSFVVVGIIIVVIATLLYGVVPPSFNAIIFIGPFPIVFGAGSESGLMIVAGLLVALLSIILFWVVNRKVRRNSC
jgi:uncharacterized membrane protein